jgi:hypothetical protein
MFSRGFGDDEGFDVAADAASDVGQPKTKTAATKLLRPLRTIRPDISQMDSARQRSLCQLRLKLSILRR